MSQPVNNLYAFGEYHLDVADRLLWRGDEVVTLPPKVFDTLSILVKSEGRIVSKSELMEAIWSDAFVEESNLSQNIYTLRRTLGVDEAGRQFIETVPRRGYRFAVPVRLLEPVQKQESSADTPPVFIRADPPGANEQIFVRSYALLTVLALLVLGTIGFGGYWLISRRNTNHESAVAPIEQVRFERLTNSGDVIFPTISPNGELLAYVRHEADGESVWVKQITSGSAVQTLPSSPKGYESIAFTPDGKYLLFRETADPAGIYQTSVFGGALKKVADNVWSGFSISPDGKWLAYRHLAAQPERDEERTRIGVIQTDGNGEPKLFELQMRRPMVQWSADSKGFYFADGRFNASIVWRQSLDGGEPEKVAEFPDRIFNFAWSRDEKHLVVSRGRQQGDAILVSNLP